MKRFPVLLVLALAAAAAVALSSSQRPAGAHCEVPCGIFDDGERFKALLENQTTMAKAMDQVNHLAAEKMGPQDMNQMVRWVMVKEDHATKSMDIAGQYFMAQRIKPAAAGDEAGSKRYVDLLTKAHAVMVTAMKCKQTVDPAAATAHKDAITAFQAAYEAK